MMNFTDLITSRCVSALLMVVFMAESLAAITPAHGQSEVQQELMDVRQRIEQLEGEAHQDWIQELRAASIRQLTSDILADASQRSMMQASEINAYYDEGFCLESADGNYLFRFNILTQNNWTYGYAPGQGSKKGFSQKRVRLYFSGHIGDPSLQFMFITQAATEGGEFESYSFSITKDLGKGFEFTAGVFTGPFSRLQIMAAAEILGSDYPVISGQWDQGNMQGIMLAHEGEDFRVEGMISNGFERQGVAAITNNRLGVMGRGELKIAGEWSDFNTQLVRRGSGFASMLGAAFSYDWLSTNQPQTNPPNLLDPSLQNNAIFRAVADLSLQGSGWILYGAFFCSRGESSLLQNRYGFLGEAGWFPIDNLQLFARYQWGTIEDVSNPDLNIVSGGISFFPTTDAGLPSHREDVRAGNKVKVTLEAGYAFDAVMNWNIEAPGWREDLNASDSGQWILRTQVQFSF